MEFNQRLFQFITRIIFYVMLIILIISLIYPHTSLYFRTSLFSPFTSKLNSEDVILTPGETFRLRVYRINKKATYWSTDFKVCNVSINGILKAKRVGTAIIKVKIERRVLKCRVRVIRINKSSIIIRSKKTEVLKIWGIRSRVRWSSSNPFVASVNLRGKVTAKKRGKAIIKARVKGKKLTCVVIVY
ncbi:Ig-like domain-containing protein [Anaeromicropila herbilytica]|uniref:BIG2 domain-containing protein n=1 Tax=Anaeromicropila herbilytica TaxID=2785025 RepID=A0A7R7EM75_9FIRM|nr:Ig-like domain-containing protein [Anaeromicropila herbilytica]BCN31404.1 hypothetical protein bsdtb5_26990 [Anaeromicropila herbilytica]